MQSKRFVQIAAVTLVGVASLVVAPALADALYVQREDTVAASPAGLVPAVEEVDVAAYSGLLPGGVSSVDAFAQ